MSESKAASNQHKSVSLVCCNPEQRPYCEEHVNVRMLFILTIVLHLLTPKEGLQAVLHHWCQMLIESYVSYNESQHAVSTDVCV